MDFQQTLGGYKEAIDRRICHHFDAMINQIGKENELIAVALKQTKKIALGGGKRIRGALLQCVYAGVGGKEKKKILEVAVAVEFLHLFFLVHDDIIDRGNLRHGEETIHRFFEKRAGKKSDAAGSEHFGNSMAVIIGDLLFAKAGEIILNAGFEEKETIAALSYLQEMVGTTIVGQVQDIAIESGKGTTEEKILRMYENKTAKYTFQGPLRLGLIFAKVKDRKTTDLLDRYAGFVGKAFQLQDDILGVFGDRKKIGKSTVSDIEEGKLSLMVIRARSKSGQREREILNGILGKKKVSQKEIGLFKKILIESGAKGYVHDLTRQYLQAGKAEIEKAVLMSASKKFLLGMIEYLEKREV